MGERVTRGARKISELSSRCVSLSRMCVYLARSFVSRDYSPSVFKYSVFRFPLQRTKGVHSRPRFTLPRQFTNSSSHKSSKSTSKHCPLMQIAEKYRKELREYNEGSLNLLPSENRLEAENEKLAHGERATKLDANSEEEEKVVEESSNLKETVIPSMECSTSSSGETKGKFSFGNLKTLTSIFGNNFHHCTSIPTEYLVFPVFLFLNGCDTAHVQGCKVMR